VNNGVKICTLRVQLGKGSIQSLDRVQKSDGASGRGSGVSLLAPQLAHDVDLHRLGRSSHWLVLGLLSSQQPECRGDRVYRRSTGQE